MDNAMSPVELSREELDFIRQLCQSAEEELQTLAEGATIDVPDNASNLLSLLLLSDKIRLQAEVGNYTLVFEPKAGFSDDGQMRQLHLGYPSILENNDHHRSYRIDKTNGDIRLSDTSGKLKNLRVENVSETGLELASDTPTADIVPGETVLSLKLGFPDNRWVPCKGTVVRVNPRKKNPTLALRFLNASPRMQDLLRAYIYTHSPELVQETESPKPRKPPRTSRR